MFKRLFDGLRKTRERLSEGFSRLFGAGRRLDAEFLEELEETLYTADLGPCRHRNRRGTREGLEEAGGHRNR